MARGPHHARNNELSNNATMELPKNKAGHGAAGHRAITRTVKPGASVSNGEGLNTLLETISSLISQACNSQDT